MRTTITNRNCSHKEIKSRLKPGNACYHYVQNLLSFSLLSKNIKIKIYRNIIFFVVVYEYQIDITNRFTVLENLNEDEDVNRTWENIKENNKTSAKESLGVHEWKQHKPWFDEECLGFLDQTKRAKMQWVQDPSQSNVDNLNSVRREDSRHFRNKKKAYLRAKIQ